MPGRRLPGTASGNGRREAREVEEERVQRALRSWSRGPLVLLGLASLAVATAAQVPRPPDRSKDNKFKTHADAQDPWVEEFALAWAEIDDFVGRSHDGRFVLDNNDGVSRIAEFLKNLDELGGVAGVETDTRFIQNEQCVDQTRAEAGGEIDALGFTAGPLSMLWLRERAPFATAHAFLGTATLALFAATFVLGRRLERHRGRPHDAHAFFAVLAALLAGATAIAGFVLLP